MHMLLNEYIGNWHVIQHLPLLFNCCSTLVGSFPPLVPSLLVQGGLRQMYEGNTCATCVKILNATHVYNYIVHALLYHRIHTILTSDINCCSTLGGSCTVSSCTRAYEGNTCGTWSFEHTGILLYEHHLAQG